MATGLKSRIIFREHATENATLAGTYKLLVRATKIPSPIKDPDVKESSTLEDMVQTFETGRAQSGLIKAEGFLDERTYLDAINAMAGKKVDVIHLYGTDGLGGLAKYSYVAQISAVPGDVDDGIIPLSVSIIPNTAPIDVFATFTVTEAVALGISTFTVAPKA